MGPVRMGIALMSVGVVLRMSMWSAAVVRSWGGGPEVIGGTVGDV